MPPITVVLSKPDKQGRPRAQIKIGSKALPAVLLEEFSESVRQALQGAPVGSIVNCEDTNDPQPALLQARQLAASTTSRSGRPTPDKASTPRRPPVDAQARGDRAQADFPVADGAALPRSSFDNNPYNFAEWIGSTPLKAREPEKAKHDRWYPDRYSGVVTIRLTAKSPIFVPEGTILPADDRTPRRFWRCRDGDGEERFGIPGSTMKGVARTLFETLTNSRLTIVSEGHYKPIPFRRRCSKAWVIVGTRANGDLDVRSAEVSFGIWKPGGRWTRRLGARVDTRLPAPLSQPAVDPNNTNWQVIPFRANLLWTPDHRHSQVRHLAVKIGTQSAAIPASVVRKYHDMLRHDAVQNHPQMIEQIVAAGLGTNYYKFIPPNAGVEEPVELRIAELADLPVGQVVFGFTHPTRANEIVSFGKNTHYLWPAEKSPRDLVGGFWPRGGRACLTDSDSAEAAFGFAGSYRDGGHPFRSRVRFGTFWALDNPREGPELRLRALTSPTGVKLKARPLYLPPAGDNRAQSYDEATKLRGRKFYWHQVTSDGSVPTCHLDTGTQAVGQTQLPPPILPLPRNTEFEGEVHFDNLTNAELGALLVALVPDLLFREQDSPAEFGYKIGKAKPRGLGSVHPSLEALRLRRPPASCYGSPESEVIEKADASDFVKSFEGSMLRPLGGRAAAFMQDLANLLRLPGDVKDYCATPGAYNWQPEWNDRDGEPRGGRGARPTAMPLAR